MDAIHELLRREAQAVLDIPVTDAYEKGSRLDYRASAPQKGKVGYQWHG